jgi:hypothetical protein
MPNQPCSPSGQVGTSEQSVLSVAGATLGGTHGMQKNAGKPTMRLSPSQILVAYVLICLRKNSCLGAVSIVLKIHS